MVERKDPPDIAVQPGSFPSYRPRYVDTEPEHGIVEITKGVALRHPFCYMILIIILEIIIICGIIIV